MIHFTSLLMAVIPVICLAEMDFFAEQRLEYWESNVPESKNIEIKKPASAISKPGPKKDEWDKYLNPSSIEDLKEVFREGDHTPPTPLLIGIQNPTYENAKRWLRFIQLKNKLSRPFLRQLARAKAEQVSQTKRGVIEKMSSQVSKASYVAGDYERFRFRMYFDSTCPHCKRMFGTLEELRGRGYYVEAVQLDSRKVTGLSGIPIFRATLADLQKYKEERVPFTVVADMKRGGLIGPIRGYQPIESVNSFISQAIAKN